MRIAHISRSAALLLAGCATNSTVVRRSGGQDYVGRRVPAEAYAAYARGLAHEARGEAELAEQEFGAACQADPASGAAWAGRGRVSCDQDLETAEELFSRGLELAIERVPVLVARGECRLSHGDGKGALADAEAALELAPDSRRVAALLEQTLVAGGRFEAARRIQLTARLRDALLRNSVPDVAVTPQELDVAIRTLDLTGVRRAARGHLEPGQLALRLFALGRTVLAEEQAVWVLAADPDQTDAAVALWLVRAPRTGAPPPSSDAPDPTLHIDGPLSTLGALLIAHRLKDGVDEQSAGLFLEKWGPIVPKDDLERALMSGLPSREAPSNPLRL